MKGIPLYSRHPSRIQDARLGTPARRPRHVRAFGHRRLGQLDIVAISQLVRACRRAGAFAAILFDGQLGIIHWKESMPWNQSSTEMDVPSGGLRMMLSLAETPTIGLSSTMEQYSRIRDHILAHWTMVSSGTDLETRLHS